ncbi:hypothetical protein EBU95_18895 [bacterium]|nr:hypothetical protein [bacterium]
MIKMIRTGKQNRHEKITQVMLSGKPVTPEEIAEVFKGTDQEAVLYRLSTNIYNIRLDGGIVKVHKNGRKVTAYQLVNYTEFDANGRYIGNQASQVKADATSQVSDEVTVEVKDSTETVEA